jgi:large subunit ribosomal protein L29
MNEEELAHHLEASKEEFFNLRFQLAMGKQDNSSRLGNVRREIARVLTLQRERQGDVADAAVPGKGPADKRKVAR